MSGKKDWFYHARKDLLSAQALFELEEPIYENVAMFCQQCIEKAIKGFLISKKKRFKKTHDIGYLLSLLADASEDLVISLKWSSDLTNYYIYVRYPEADEDVDLSPEKVKELLEKTIESHQLILSKVNEIK